MTKKQIDTRVKPFLRWVGSKQFAVEHILQYCPKNFGTYFEPFLGGGSLFFSLQPASAKLNDRCVDLIATYCAVRNNYKKVFQHLEGLTPNRELFYQIRENMSKSAYKRAAQFIYLNKTCWNGLYRVNKSGKFNVPYGLPRSPKIIDIKNLESCSRVLQEPRIELTNEDFEVCLRDAMRGDLVFLDPPYITGHLSNGFIDYNEQLFSWYDQERLASCARELVARGVSVLITSPNHKAIRRLYKSFNSVVLHRNSTLASDKGKRGPVTELLVYSISRPSQIRKEEETINVRTYRTYRSF